MYFKDAVVSLSWLEVVAAVGWLLKGAPDILQPPSATTMTMAPSVTRWAGL